MLSKYDDLSSIHTGVLIQAVDELPTNKKGYFADLIRQCGFDD
jgi:hypothetical protein